MKKYGLLILLTVSITFALTPTGYVNDFAGVLTDAPFIEQELRNYEKDTTIEIVVVTLDSLPEDQTLFTYGVELFDQWNIGKRGEDNGILVLLVKNGTPGNRMRIELGYGIQGYITGAEAGRVLDEALHDYEQGNYQSAVATILVGLSRELEGYTPYASSDGLAIGNDMMIPVLTFALSNLPFAIFIIVLIVSIAMRNRCPYCLGPIRCSGDQCVCRKCGRRFSRKKRYAPVLVGGSFGGGGGFSGFGGGASGGGGAGR